MRARQARGASGGLDWNLLSRDLKPLQLVGIYEKQKATMAWELGDLRSQVTSLCHELQHKENNAAATRQHDVCMPDALLQTLSKFHLVQITDRCGGKNHSQATTLLEQLCDKLQVGSAAQLAVRTLRLICFHH
ncbi:uncharacterized protein LOC112341123 isoform X1 [Selaginella moellendorffii]|uniref:uncharacterized protein LOC112341123 isoform X1 n=1 Tax=Selaginella moellendorffii TaxID=88036 RepID=UPI000D1D0FE6|nr:uncharacterized protein LOC112341123 isoform X1 [Selaginella moellendorffii]|eukprot:XP_024516453.1 uncharacterized protein LOC112341123 isoform X1 [Selaginella moellendorffii]